MMSKYVRLTKGLYEKGQLITPDQISKYFGSEKDVYTSTFYYNQEQFNKFKETGSVKGIKDVLTDKIWWDFDDEFNPENAQNDALTVINKLKEYNISENNIEVYFSGNKGFNILLNINKEITPKQVQAIACKFALNLQTFDASMYDSPQLLRIPGTRHQKSNLFKIPLTVQELSTLTIEQIREKATSLDNIHQEFEWEVVSLDDSLFEVEEVKEELKIGAMEEFDLTTKPRQWKASKWALMQGFFGPGERNQTMMILSATCKAMGYDKITSYYMCKSAIQKSWERYGKGDFTKEELWNIIERIYSDEWNGGAYSEKDDAFLQKKSGELGIKELTTTSTVNIGGALKIYKDYAKNINKLTLKTGIKEIDDRQRITVGMSFGVIAAPGVGKTSIALQMLYSMSQAGELCIFFSYDMYAPLIVQKIIQKHWPSGDIEQVFKRYENNDQEYVKKVEELITKEYPNVEFCFDSAQTIDEIYQTIHDAEQKRGQKCKFVVIDYNELVMTDVSDPTQSSNYVAQKVRELASKEQICVLSLFQPSKLTGDPSTEIKSYRAAKGGSAIEQSVSLMFGISRPGFDPRDPDNDKYLTVNCVKNRMGPIFSIDLYWNGYKGEVRSLTQQERVQLQTLRKAKEDEKNGKVHDDWQ